MHEILGNTILKGGLVLSIIAGVGMWLKSLLPVFWNLIMRTISHSSTIESKSELFNIFNEWLAENHSDKYKKVLSRTVNKKGSVLQYVETNFNSFFWFWYKGKPVMVTSTREKFESNFGGPESSHIDSYSITIFFSKTILTELLKTLIEKHNEKIKLENGICLYDYKVNWEEWYKVNKIDSKPYDKIFNQEKFELYNDLKHFFENKEYYDERGIPYKRGYLLYGVPGNGKTSTILAVAKELKKNVYNLNLTSIMTDEHLKAAFRTLPDDALIMMEDVDSSTNGREMVNKLGFNTFLNVLDGVLSKKNICIFFTTNHIEKMDSALLRCGRIDKKIEFKNPEYEDVVGLLKLFYTVDLVPTFKYKSKFSASELQEICIECKSMDEAINKIKSK